MVNEWWGELYVDLERQGEERGGGSKIQNQHCGRFCVVPQKSENHPPLQPSLCLSRPKRYNA